MTQAVHITVLFMYLFTLISCPLAVSTGASRQQLIITDDAKLAINGSGI